MDVFKKATAVVIADRVRPEATCSLQVDGRELPDQVFLLSVTGSGAVNLQIDMNFSNTLFVTVFGDKLTPLTFRGLALPSICEDGQEASAIAGLYNRYKASAGGDVHVLTVAYNKGDFVFKGILTQMSIQPYNQSGADGFVFDLTLQGRVMDGGAGSAATGGGGGSTAAAGSGLGGTDVTSRAGLSLGDSGRGLTRSTKTEISTSPEMRHFVAASRRTYSTGAASSSVSSRGAVT